MKRLNFLTVPANILYGYLIYENYNLPAPKTSYALNQTGIILSKSEN